MTTLEEEALIESLESASKTKLFLLCKIYIHALAEITRFSDPDLTNDDMLKAIKIADEVLK